MGNAVPSPERSGIRGEGAHMFPSPPRENQGEWGMGPPVRPAGHIHVSRRLSVRNRLLFRKENKIREQMGVLIFYLKQKIMFIDVNDFRLYS